MPRRLYVGPGLPRDLTVSAAARVPAFARFGARAQQRWRLLCACARGSGELPGDRACGALLALALLARWVHSEGCVAAVRAPPMSPQSRPRPTLTSSRPAGARAGGPLLQVRQAGEHLDCAQPCWLRVRRELTALPTHAARRWRLAKRTTPTGHSAHTRTRHHRGHQHRHRRRVSPSTASPPRRDRTRSNGLPVTFEQP
jgi:hypothetical protein